MKIINLMLFVLFAASSYGQNLTSDSKRYLKIAPLGLIDFYNGSTLRVGAEFQIKNNYSTYCEIGTYLPITSDFYFWPKSNTKGALTKVEVKI